VIRPANPVCCDPFRVIEPVYSKFPSVNTGSGTLPLASDGTVVVTEAALTVAVPVPLSSTRSVDPAGLENCRLAAPKGLFNCETMDTIPPEKLRPITCLFGPGPAFDNGSAAGSSTRTIVTWCRVLVAVSV